MKSKIRKGLPLPKKYLGWSLLFLISFVSFGQVAYGQSKSLFSYNINARLNEKQQHFADAWIKKDWAKSYKYITIDPNSFKADVVNINLPEKASIQADKVELIEHSGDLYSWKGKFGESLGNADFVVHDDMITARISSADFVYLIYPISGGLHVLIECSGPNMPQDESAEGYQSMIEQGVKSAAQNEAARQDPETGLKGSARLLGGDCKVRIIVMYTNTTAANMADPIGFINSCIDATNTAYNNSGINFNVELAVAKKVAYTESLNSSTDKTRFRNTSDGFIDEVHDLRAYFDADMCVLITENLQSNVCGEAYTVANSPYADAFCVVTRGCSVGNLSFPHELGHLYGCRHDTYVDNSTTPYAYGHGYVYFTGRWRTVMAYNNFCSDNGANCTRLQYFSNPAVNYLGNATGVSGISDNESATEASRANISSLEATTINKVFPNAYTFNSGEQSDVIAISSVTNSTTFVFNSGSSGTWRSGGSMTMSTGFWAKAGAKFRAFNDNCTALRPTNEQAVVAGKKVNPNDESASLQLFPNPFTSNFDVILKSSEEANVRISLYNTIGMKISEKAGLNISKGTNKVSFDGSKLQKGVYMVEVYVKDQKMVRKIVKM